MHLVAEFPATSYAFLSKTEEPRQVMRRLALVQLPSHPAAVILVIQRLQNVDGLLNTTDFRKSLIDAVLTGIRTKPKKHQRWRNNPFLDRCDHPDGLIPGISDQRRLDGPRENRIQIRVMLLAV